MIVKIEMFTVACENCHNQFKTDEYCAWNDADSARYQSEESGWHHEPSSFIAEADKHYCPNCWEYNDEDELVIKPILKS